MFDMQRTGMLAWVVTGPNGSAVIRRNGRGLYLVGRSEPLTPGFFCIGARRKRDALAHACKMTSPVKLGRVDLNSDFLNALHAKAKRLIREDDAATDAVAYVAWVIRGDGTPIGTISARCLERRSSHPDYDLSVKDLLTWALTSQWRKELVAPTV